MKITSFRSLLPRPLRSRQAAYRLCFDRLEDRVVPSTLQPITGPNLQLPPSDTAGEVSQFKASADGRYIVYTSEAPNLVTNQITTTPASNVFLFDAQQRTTTLVSHALGANTTTANSDSTFPRVSGDGRYIAYTSYATNLVPGQAGPRGAGNVFLYDRFFNTTMLVSHAAGLPTTSANDGSSTGPTSGFGFTQNSGGFLLYASYATDLVFGQSGPARSNLYLYDTQAQTSTLVSHSALSPTVGGNNDVLFTADISQDGNSVVYTSVASDMVFGQNGPGANVFLFDRFSGTNRLVSGAIDPFFGTPSPTVGAGFVTTAVISANGRYVTYISEAPNLVPFQAPSVPFPTFNVFSYDVFSQSTILVSGAVTPFGPSPSVTADGNSYVAAVSGDGSSIAFISDATNLFPNQGFSTRNVFVVNPFQRTLRLASRVPFTPLAAGGTVLNNDTDFTDLSISADGQFVTYQSTAPNLIPGQPDPFGRSNVFVYSQPFDSNALISRVNGSSGTGDQDSTAAAISLDGTSIAFLSFATNLNPGVTRGAAGQDLFVYPRGGSGPLLLSSRSAFRASASSFVYGTSFDGRYVVFTSNATNVVPGQIDSNNDQDVFLLDRNTGITALVSHVPESLTTTANTGSPSTSGGRGTPGDPVVISQDGNWVAFVSRATNLVEGQFQPNQVDPRIDNVFLYSTQTGEVRLVSHAAFDDIQTGSGPSADPQISADGRFIAFISLAKDLVPGLTGNQADGFKVNVFLYDRDNPDVAQVLSNIPQTPITGDGHSSGPAISDDGRFVVFQSYATNLLAGVNPTSNIFLADRLTGSLTLVSHTPLGGSANGSSFDPVISPDGNFVAFLSFATDLVPGQRVTGFTNVFLFSRQTGQVTLVSGVNGSASFSGSGFSDSPSINTNGRFAAFRSDARDLVPGQTGPAGSNIFVYDSQNRQVVLASHAVGSNTTTASGDSFAPTIDGDGVFVSYVSTATNLVPGQTGGGVNNVFGFVRILGANFLASGVNGSPTAASPDPAFLAIVSRDPVVVFSVAGSLTTSVQATVNGYVNSPFVINLTLIPFDDGSPAGTRVGTLSVTTLLQGQGFQAQFLVPAGGAPDNNKFTAVGSELRTQVPVNTGTQSTFTVQVQLTQSGSGSPFAMRNFTLTANVQPGNATFVKRLYLDLLNRDAEPSGLTYWVGLLDRNVNRQTVAQAIWRSDEHLTMEVNGFYTTYLRRTADAGGRAHWVNVLKSGVSEEQVVRTFLLTPEYLQKNAGSDAFVRAIYFDLLGRDAGLDPNGLNYWKSVFNGAGAAAVVDGIEYSFEAHYKAVDRFYAQYLRRGADEGGRGYWIGKLQRRENTLTDVAVLFLAAPEYFDKAGT